MTQGRRHLGTTFTIGLLAAPLLARAAAADDVSLEDIVVIGSRIARSDYVSPSPVVTVGQDAFEQVSTVSVERVLDNYPQFVPTAGATSVDPSDNGQGTVSLRGLGSNRTLVLLDGRRLTPADGRGVVDLNVLPASLLRSVQVLTGGASTAYGSDAIAGVVNFELMEDFTGVSLHASASTTDRGDGEEYSLGATAGTRFGDDRGSIVAAVEYADRRAILQSDRSFSKYPLAYFRDESSGRGPGGAFVPGGEGVNDDGVHIVFADPAVFQQVFAGYGIPVSSTAAQQGFGVNADGTVFTIGTGEPGSVLNYRGVRDPVMFSDRGYAVYNSAPFTALQMPLERTSAFLRGTWQLNDAAELYGQVLYADYAVERQLDPAAVGIVLIPPTNPYIPADLATLLASRVDATAPYRYFRRASEVGPQMARNDRTLVQVTTGVRGSLGARWTFDAYAQFGENDRTERQTNNVSLSRLQDLTFAPDGGASICAGGFNPYRAGSLSPDCARYIAVDASNEITVRQSLAEVSIDGVLGALPSGDVRAAAGLFYKRDEFRYDADAALSRVLPAVPGLLGPRPDVSGFPAAPDRAGDESNVDAYVELRVPLLAPRRGADALDLGLGYRRSEYTQAGGVDAWKAELLWRPVTPLRLRSSYQHAVRAPSIEELYYPLVADQFEIPRPDPCDVSSPDRNGPDRAQVEALCVAQGISPALLPGYRYDLRRVDGVSGGNPDLQPEEADTVTAGVVLEFPADAAGHRAHLSVDWYQIEIDDGIGRWDSKSAVERCFDPSYNPGFDASNVYCGFFSRDPVTGHIRAEIIDRNIGGLETAGVDVQFDWSHAAGPGDLGLNLLATYVDHWTYLDPSGGAIEYAGTVGGGGLGRSLPRWKSLATLQYSLGGADLLLRWQHIEGMRDVVERDFRVPAYDYLDLGASYAVEQGPLRGLHVRVGVDNVTDRPPPIFPTWQQANTDPSQYDVLGRRYYLRLEYAL